MKSCFICSGCWNLPQTATITQGGYHPKELSVIWMTTEHFVWTQTKLYVVCVLVITTSQKQDGDLFMTLIELYLEQTQCSVPALSLTSLKRGSGMAERSIGHRSVMLTKRASSTVMAQSTWTHLCEKQTWGRFRPNSSMSMARCFWKSLHSTCFYRVHFYTDSSLKWSCSNQVTGKFLSEFPHYQLLIWKE